MVELRRVKGDAVVTLSDVLAATGRLPAGWAGSTDGLGVECDLDLIRQLTQKAATFLPADEIDGWLAPRLHVALRLPRRLASDDGIWAWLAFQCPEYVAARFQRGSEKVHPWRYRGMWSRNALARLWWGAEMTRNGGDYSATELCFRRTRTAQFALELMYSWDRAACIAFCRVAEGIDGGARLNDSQTKRLSTKLKVLLTLRSLNAFGDGSEEDSYEYDSQWAAHRPSFASLVTSDVRTLPGPTVGSIEEARLGELTVWFRSVVDAIEDEQASSESSTVGVA
jgi:hypothetical protein